MMKFLKKEKLFLAIFAFSVVIFLWDLFFLKKAFIYGDYKQQFFPWSMEYARAIKNFMLPSWISSMGCGFPLVAEGQVGAFYPINIFLFFILPPIAAYSYGVILHFMLGGIFMYIFMRALKLDGLSAILPSVLFMFASPYAGCFSNIASLKTLCWFPLTLYLILISFERNKPLILISSGIIMGIQLLAGAPQMAFYSIVFSASYLLFLLFTVKGKAQNVRFRYVASFAAAGIIAFVLWVPQLIATNNLLMLSERSTRDISFALARSFFPAGILTMSFPCTSTIFEGLIYIGALPALFAAVAFFNVKNRQALFFMILFIVSLFCAFGRFNPLYVMALKLSNFYLFRVPSKFLFFSAFSVIILSGFGFQSVTEGAGRRRANTVVYSIYAVSLAAVIFLNASLRIWRDEIVALVRDYVSRYVYSPILHKHSMQYYMDKVSGLYQNALNALSFSNQYIFIQALILTVSTAIFILYNKRMMARALFQRLCVTVIFIDLLFFSPIGAGFRGNIVNISDAVKKSDAVDFIKKDDSLFRVYLFKLNETEDALQPNLNVYWGVDNIGVYSPLIFKRYKKILGDLGCVDDSTGVIMPSEENLYKNLSLLGMLNVKYIVSQDEIADRNLKFLKDMQSGKRLYLNKAVLPRAFVVHKVIVMSDENEILNVMKSRGFDPKGAVIVEENIDQMTESAGTFDARSKIDIVRYTDREIEIKTRTGNNGMLVLSDYFYPGWKAYLDGKPVKIFRANYIVRAVYLPKGEHIIKFRY